MGENTFKKSTIKLRTNPKVSDVRKSLVRDNAGTINKKPTVLCTSRTGARNKNVTMSTKLPDQCLNQPSLCSTKIFENYLKEVQSEQTPKLNLTDVQTHEREIGEEVTKKLNFHMNDRVYRNLIDLNASIHTNQRKKNIRKDSEKLTVRKDIEPNLEDFYDDTIEADILPPLVINQPIIKVKSRLNDNKLRDLITKYDT